MAHALVVEESIGGLGLVAIGQRLRKGVERFFGQMGEQALKPRVEAGVRQGGGRGHLSGPERCGKRWRHPTRASEESVPGISSYGSGLSKGKGPLRIVGNTHSKGSRCQENM